VAIGPGLLGQMLTMGTPMPNFLLRFLVTQLLLSAAPELRLAWVQQFELKLELAGLRPRVHHGHSHGHHRFHRPRPRPLQRLA
jgi:hypothetical protein